MHAPHMRHVNTRIKTAQVSWAVGGPIPKQIALTWDNSHCAFTIKHTTSRRIMHHLDGWSGERGVGPMVWSPVLRAWVDFVNGTIRNL